MASESKIKRVLEHLAWLKEQAGEEINQGRVYDAAILTYNAAVMLQWHFVMSTSAADHIQNPSTRRRAAKLIEGFVWSVRGKVEKLSHAAVSSYVVKGCREELLCDIDSVLTKLPKQLGLLPLAISRDTDLERPLQLRKLIDDQLDESSPKGPATKELPFAAALAEHIFVSESPVVARMTPSTQVVLRQIASGFLATEIETAIEACDDARSQRWRAVADALTASD